MSTVAAYTAKKTSHSAAARRLMSSGAERARYDHLLYLIRALADREDLRVAVEAADRILLDVAVAAVDLNGLVRRLHREAPRLQLRLRGNEAEVAPLILEPRRLVRQQAGRLDLGGQVGQLRLDGLKARDRLPERAPLLGVGERLVERALCQPDAHRRHADPPAVERLQELLEAAPARAEQVLLGHARAVEAERPCVRRVPAHLAVRLADLVAGRVLRDDDVGDL